MAFKIITADERMARKKPIKGAIFGPHGVGKTSLLWTVDPDKTLFLNLEGGDLAIQDCPVDSIEIGTWEDAMNMACLITGPDPSRRSDQAYSQAHYDYVAKENDPSFLKKYETVFWDSISVASRLASLVDRSAQSASSTVRRRMCVVVSIGAYFITSWS